MVLALHSNGGHRLLVRLLRMRVSTNLQYFVERSPAYNISSDVSHPAARRKPLLAARAAAAATGSMNIHRRSRSGRGKSSVTLAEAGAYPAAAAGSSTGVAVGLAAMTEGPSSSFSQVTTTAPLSADGAPAGASFQLLPCIYDSDALASSMLL